MNKIKMKKVNKVYILPNLLTTANMFCGFQAIISSIHGNFINAAWLIFVAMVFDLLDGRVARLTRATSKFGVEYDSFSDLVSFGITPALVAYLWCLAPLDRAGWLSAFLFVACAALRLARFNIMVEVVSKKHFQGIPSPIAAAAVATLIIFWNYYKPGEVPPASLVFGIVLVAGSLMISTIPYPSFKEFKVKRENAFGVLSVTVLGLILIAVRPEVGLFVLVYSYITIGFFAGVYKILFGKPEASSILNQNVSPKEIK